MLNLCSSSSSIVVSNFAFDIDFEGTPTFTNSATYGNVYLLNGGTIVSSWNFQQAIISTGKYTTVSGVFDSPTQATQLNLWFVAPNPDGSSIWQGYVYIDNFRINY